MDSRSNYLGVLFQEPLPVNETASGAVWIRKLWNTHWMSVGIHELFVFRHGKVLEVCWQDGI
jgi:hypothetical protein